MGAVVERHVACFSCDSSDAMIIYEDGAHCFSCDKSFSKKFTERQLSNEESDNDAIRVKRIQRKQYREPNVPTVEEIAEYPFRGFKDRLIHVKVSEFYGVRASFNEDGDIDTHYYPYNTDRDRLYKIRKLPKEFLWTKGHNTTLFGQERFGAGGKRLVITEGEIDALTVATASYKQYNKFYPVVAVPSAASEKLLISNRKWIRSFKEVVLMLDNDEAGDKFRDKAVKIIGFDKVKIANYNAKDPNELAINEGMQAVLAAIWDATEYRPASVVDRTNLKQRLKDFNKIPSIPFPAFFAGVNEKTKGRRRGEITLFISGTGSGKSSLVREIAYDTAMHNLEEGEKVGIIALEETPEETSKKLICLHMGVNPAEHDLTDDEIDKYYDEVFGKGNEPERIIILDHQASVTDDSIVDLLEYMALIGCKDIIIDHITILVSEGVENLQGNEAVDKMMNHLLRIVKRHNVWIGLISHLRKTSVGSKSFEQGKLPNMDDIRGSGSIKQISMDIIGFARNMDSSNETERNTIKVSVLKCRLTGNTGRVSSIFFDVPTGRLKEAFEEFDEEDFQICH